SLFDSQVIDFVQRLEARHHARQRATFAALERPCVKRVRRVGPTHVADELSEALPGGWLTNMNGCGTPSDGLDLRLPQEDGVTRQASSEPIIDYDVCHELILDAASGEEAPPHSLR